MTPDCKNHCNNTTLEVNAGIPLTCSGLEFLSTVQHYITSNAYAYVKVIKIVVCRHLISSFCERSSRSCNKIYCTFFLFLLKIN